VFKLTALDKSPHETSELLLWQGHVFGQGLKNDLDATVLSVVKRPVSIGHFP
jgi:hypothetical protein